LPIEANEDNQSKKIHYKIKERGKTEEIEKRERKEKQREDKKRKRERE
jgi:hypothetical protein